MSKSEAIYQKLSAPFSEDKVKFRAGANNNQSGDRLMAQALAFVSVNTVMDRLDEVLGVDGWWDQYEVIREGEQVLAVSCSLSVVIEGKKVTKSDVATVDFIDQDKLEDESKGTREKQKRLNALKSAYSDSLKRASVKIGIARYIKRLESPWVQAERRGSMVFLKQRPKLPEWALPLDTDEQPGSAQTVHSFFDGLRAEVMKASKEGLAKAMDYVQSNKALKPFEREFLLAFIEERQEEYLATEANKSQAN